jgi:hypothetical protein
VIYGGDSGNRIFVLYWRCSLIRVSVIRGSTVYILSAKYEQDLDCNRSRTCYGKYAKISGLKMT